MLIHSVYAISDSGLLMADIEKRVVCVRIVSEKILFFILKEGPGGISDMGL